MGGIAWGFEAGDTTLRQVLGGVEDLITGRAGQGLRPFLEIESALIRAMLNFIQTPRRWSVWVTTPTLSHLEVAFTFGRY
jgi:hypothetical protein